MLLSQAAVDAASAITADDFYKPAHGHIYEAIIAVHDAGHRAEPTTVEVELERRGLIDDIGGRTALIDLQIATPDAGAAARYASIVHDHAVLRHAIAFGHDIIEAGYQLDQPATLRATEAALDLLDRAAALAGPAHMRTVLEEWVEDLAARADGRKPGIPTGFYDLDRATGGLRPGQLIVVAGRTSMGKTAFAGSLVLNAVAAGHTTLVCSIEMARLELTDRYMSAVSRIDATFIRDGAIAVNDWPRINRGVAELAERPLWIDDRAELTVGQIRGAARSIPNLKLIVVDYLQLLKTNDRDNRATEVAEISGGLKNLARRLGVPIVALAQLNRDTERRTDKRPLLIDLRESGSIENDADLVIGLYRDEYYKPKSDDAGIIEAIIMKQRSGPTQTVRLGFDAIHTEVLNLAMQEEF